MCTLACGAVAGCHCWVPLLGIGALLGIGVHVGGLDVVLPLLGAGCRCWVALPLLAAIARWHAVRCHGKVPLLGAIAGCHVVRFHCWVPLLDAVGGDRLDVVPLYWVPW